MKIRYTQSCIVQCQAQEFFKGPCPVWSPPLTVSVTHDEGLMHPHARFEIVVSEETKHLLLRVPAGVRHAHAYFCAEHREVIERELKLPKEQP